MILRKQTIVLLTAILLMVGQLMVVMHSAVHPFHASDALCAVYQHAEQHHANVAVVNNAVDTIFFQVRQPLLVHAADTTLFRYFRLPRSPPVS